MGWRALHGHPSPQSDSPCPAGLWKLPHIPLEDRGIGFGLKLEKVLTPSRTHPTSLNPSQRWGDSWPGRTSPAFGGSRLIFFLSFPLRDEAVLPGGQGKPCAPRGLASLPKSCLPGLFPFCAPSSRVRDSEEPFYLSDLQLQS